MKAIKSITIIAIVLALAWPISLYADSQTTSATLASTIIDQAREYLGDPTTYGGTQKGPWSDAEMLQYLNDGTMTIFKMGVVEDIEIETLVENQVAYALTDPFINVVGVVYNDTKPLAPGTFKEWLEVEEHGEPAYWMPWETGVIVFPTPDATTVATGTEKVTDGDFTESTDWTWGAGWAHDAANDEADATASSADLEQDVSAIPGETYLLAWTLKNDAGGSVLPILGGTNGTTKDADGTYSEYIVATDNTNLKFDATAFTGSIDDVSVKRVANIAVYTVERPSAVAGDANVLVPAQYDLALVYFIVAQAYGGKDGLIDRGAAFMALFNREMGQQ